MGYEYTFNYSWLIYVGIVIFIAIVATCIRHRHSICGDSNATPVPVAKDAELAIVGHGTGLAPGTYTPQQQMQLQHQQYYPASGAPAQPSYPATGADGNYPSTGVQGNYPSTGVQGSYPSTSVGSPYQTNPYQAPAPYSPVQQPYPAMQQSAPYSPASSQPSPSMYAYTAPALSPAPSPSVVPVPAPALSTGLQPAPVLNTYPGDNKGPAQPQAPQTVI